MFFLFIRYNTAYLIFRFFSVVFTALYTASPVPLSSFQFLLGIFHKMQQLIKVLESLALFCKEMIYDIR